MDVEDFAGLGRECVLSYLYELIDHNIHDKQRFFRSTPRARLHDFTSFYANSLELFATLKDDNFPYIHKSPYKCDSTEGLLSSG